MPSYPSRKRACAHFSRNARRRGESRTTKRTFANFPQAAPADPFLIPVSCRTTLTIMSAARKAQLVSVDEYLACELVSPLKHEYLGGVVYAMAGARNVHNLIASNTLVSLGSRLRGGRCRPYNSDTKIRIRLPSQVRFYYPDVSVICRPNPQTDSFQDEPAAIVEVISRTTRRIDVGAKKR